MSVHGGARLKCYGNSKQEELLEKEALSQTQTLAQMSSPPESLSNSTHTQPAAPSSEPPLELTHNATVGLTTVL